MKYICTIVIKLEKDGSYTVIISGSNRGNFSNLADAEQEIHKYIMMYFGGG